jgi:hypothetical protein
MGEPKGPLSSWLEAINSDGQQLRTAGASKAEASRGSVLPSRLVAMMLLPSGKVRALPVAWAARADESEAVVQHDVRRTQLQKISFLFSSLKRFWQRSKKNGGCGCS